VDVFGDYRSLWGSSTPPQPTLIITGIRFIAALLWVGVTGKGTVPSIVQTSQPSLSPRMGPVRMMGFLSVHKCNTVMCLFDCLMQILQVTVMPT
jgi:hypothetical protein